MTAPKVKPCPFCGIDPLLWREKDGFLIEHPNNDCVMADVRTWCEDSWNRRSGDTRLLDALKAYVAADEEIGTCDIPEEVYDAARHLIAELDGGSS